MSGGSVPATGSGALYSFTSPSGGSQQQLLCATKRDMYPPPHMEDLLAQLAGKKVFSKLDLRKGYYQVPVAPQDVPKTAVISPCGLYEFLRMPFGLWAPECRTVLLALHG